MELAVDTTLVSPLHCDGSARLGAPSTDGSCPSVQQDEERRGRTQNFVGPHVVLVLVVLAGGRWSEVTRPFISQLDKANSRAEPFVLRRRVEQAWPVRWGAMLSCAAARGVCFITPGVSHRDGFRWRNPFVPRSGRVFQALRVGS